MDATTKGTIAVLRETAIGDAIEAAKERREQAQKRNREPAQAEAKDCLETQAPDFRRVLLLSISQELFDTLGMTIECSEKEDSYSYCCARFEYSGIKFDLLRDYDLEGHSGQAAYELQAHQGELFDYHFFNYPALSDDGLLLAIDAMVKSLTRQAFSKKPKTREDLILARANSQASLLTVRETYFFQFLTAFVQNHGSIQYFPYGTAVEAAAQLTEAALARLIDWDTQSPNS